MHFNPQIEQLVQKAIQDTNQGKFEDALRGLDQVRKADPQYAAQQPQIQFAAGLCLSAIGRIEAALAAFRATVELQPKNIIARLELAKLHRRTGNDPSAYVQLSKALELDPSNQRAMSQMIEHAMDQGDYEAAQRMIDPAVALVAAGASHDVAVVLLLSRLARMVGREEEAFGLLERFAASNDHNPGVRFSLKRELARCADRLGRYDEAMKHLASAHAELPTVFDADRHSARVDQMIGIWNEDTISALPRSEQVEGAPKPVFVIGVPGSGTTLVERIIGVHPNAIACGELPGLHRIAARLDPQTKGARPMLLDPSLLTGELMQNATMSYMQMVGRVLALLGSGLQPNVVTDKNSYNAFYVPMIASMFPGAKIVHVTRDPKDACLSHHMNLFGFDHPQSSDLYNLGRFARDHMRSMQHWRSMASSLGVEFHEVSYETLVANQEEQSRQLIEFAGLDWDDVCLEFYTARPAARTGCLDEIRRAIHTGSVGRHTNYAAYLGPLEAGLEGASRPAS